MGKKDPRVVRRREGRSVEEIVGERVRTLREREGTSLRGLAKSAAISMTTVSLVEQGKIAATLPTLDALALALGVGLADLFRDVPTPARTRSERQVYRRLMASLAEKDESFLRTVQRLVTALEAHDEQPVKRPSRRS